MKPTKIKKSELRNIIREEITKLLKETKVRNLDELLEYVDYYLQANYSSFARNKRASMRLYDFITDEFHTGNIKTTKDIELLIDEYIVGGRGY